MALKEDVLDFICKILSVKRDELRENVKLYDSIGVDSTEIVELTVALGKRFGVRIETNEITKFSMLIDIISLIEKKKTQK